jgi:hypothetical protein
MHGGVDGREIECALSADSEEYPCKQRPVILMELKSKSVELAPSDDKARRHIIDSLHVCAHDHILSRKLLEHFGGVSGPFVAIVGDWFDLDEMSSYDLYPGGPAGEEFASGERPTERLIEFLKCYLGSNQNLIVLCENWGAERGDIAKWPLPPPRFACYGDNDVYHILTPQVVAPEMIEAAVVPRHHWQTGICSGCSCVPDRDISDEKLLDEIDQNTNHIFIPAFDNTGYLIWTVHQGDKVRSKESGADFCDSERNR